MSTDAKRVSRGVSQKKIEPSLPTETMNSWLGEMRS